MADAPMVTLADIRKASNRLAGSVHHTPVMTADSLGDALGCELTLKAELFQRTGSFKVRGALNKLLQLDEPARRRGVVSLSAGNHAAALAFAARKVGTTAVIVMPAGASKAKIAATESYGGEVVLTAGDLLAACVERQRSEDLTFVHPFDDLDVIAGAGTVALELLEQAEPPDVVLVPVGGGGLISGVAAAIKTLHPQTRVIGVEPAGANAMTRSLLAGSPQHVTPVTIADGLAAPFAGAITLRHVQTFVDEVVEVSDDDIRQAMQLLYARAKLAAEPSAGAGLAALLAGRVINPGRVAVIVTGGNVDAERVADVLLHERLTTGAVHV